MPVRKRKNVMTDNENGTSQQMSRFRLNSYEGGR